MHQDTTYLKNDHICIYKRCWSFQKLTQVSSECVKTGSTEMMFRRNDNSCSGLSSDLVIEQTLMRRVKTSGGLPRGRGMDELQLSVWLLSTPVIAEMNQAMQEFTCVKYQTSDQQKD